jgi:hypothetical protein
MPAGDHSADGSRAVFHFQNLFEAEARFTAKATLGFVDHKARIQLEFAAQ